MNKVDDLKTIKELLEIVKQKVDTMSGHYATIHLMKEQQSVMNEKLDAISSDLGEVKETQEDHTGKLETLSGEVEEVHTKVKVIRDEIGLWHQRDKREIDEIKEHLNLPIVPDIP